MMHGLLIRPILTIVRPVFASATMFSKSKVMPSAGAWSLRLKSTSSMRGATLLSKTSTSDATETPETDDATTEPASTSAAEKKRKGRKDEEDEYEHGPSLDPVVYGPRFLHGYMMKRDETGAMVRDLDKPVLAPIYYDPKCIPKETPSKGKWRYDEDVFFIREIKRCFEWNWTVSTEHIKEHAGVYRTMDDLVQRWKELVEEKKVEAPPGGWEPYEKAAADAMASAASAKLMKAGKWTEEQDQILISMEQRRGDRSWASVHAELGINRSLKAVEKRVEQLAKSGKLGRQAVVESSADADEVIVLSKVLIMLMICFSIFVASMNPASRLKSSNPAEFVAEAAKISPSSKASKSTAPRKSAPASQNSAPTPSEASTAASASVIRAEGTLEAKPVSKIRWTEEEDMRLVSMISEGKSWGEVADAFPNRKVKGCQTRYKRLQASA
ncbi:hypothetical protein HK101_010421 [Irineochytrium annulatum]|nr:hypothetical protein HK101_010421 [Irineochytrium annulatum]